MGRRSEHWIDTDSSRNDFCDFLRSGTLYFLLLKPSQIQQKTLDPGLRRDDVLRAACLKIVIPAQAGIQCLCFTEKYPIWTRVKEGL
jgi:hypothetical protein